MAVRHISVADRFGLSAAVGKIVLPLAADIIEEAASLGNGRWGLTPYDPYLRINVGWTEILTTAADRLRLVVDGKLLRRQRIPRIITLDKGVDPRGFYPSIPGSVLATLSFKRPNELAAAIGLLRAALSRTISLAGRRRSGASVRKGHSPRLLRELSAAVGRKLPSPGYGSETDEGTEVATYLFSWNPAQKKPPSLRSYISKLQSQGTVRVPWRSGNRRQLSPGSRAFLIRLGSEPKGIVGSGWTRTKPTGSQPAVTIEFDSLQDAPRIPLSVLKHGPLSTFHWSIQGSGIELPRDIAAHLEIAWRRSLDTRHAGGTQSETLFPKAIYVNASSERLRSASRGTQTSEPIQERKPWVEGRKLLDQARAAGVELPLVFSHFVPLTFWAVVRDIVVRGKTTEYRFANLTELRGFKRSDVVVASTGQALPDTFIKSYALIHTPAFLIQPPLSDEGLLSEQVVGLEGEVRHRMIAHRRRESLLRTAKIDDASGRNGGHLVCEVKGCGFDFFAAYGELGSGYAHVHHRRGLANYQGVEKTRLDELAIVCANCHAMIHRGGECRDLNVLAIAIRR